jgi:hypothetical protein
MKKKKKRKGATKQSSAAAAYKRGEIEEGKKYLKMAEEGGYFDEGVG